MPHEVPHETPRDAPHEVPPDHQASPAGAPAAPELPWSHRLEGLPLARETAAGWRAVAVANLDAVLADHAWCEHKAAVSALGLLGRFGERPELVRPMLALAREEMMHMRQVLDVLEARGGELGAPRPDPYVRALRQRFCSEGVGLGALGDQLLVNAFVEARSCERFRILAEALGPSPDPSEARLGRFYRQLAEAEGRHWELFRDLARTLLPPARVDRRLEEVIPMEADIVASLPVAPRMH